MQVTFGVFYTHPVRKYYFHRFLPRDAMHKRDLCRHAVSVCICVSVTFVHCIKTNKDIFNLFHHRVAAPFLFFRTKRDGNTPTGSPPRTGASNAGGVG